MHLMFRRLVLPLMVMGAVVLSVAPAAAQGIGIGIKGGPVFSKLDVDDDSEAFDNRTGWMAGVFFGGNRRGVVGVGAEVNVIKRTTRGPFDDDDTALYAIDVPVYLRVNGGSRDLSGVNVYGIVGPAFDINFKANVGDLDIKDDVEDFDLNLVVGGGVEITRFIVEVRYMKGLRNINKDLSDSAPSVKTSSFAVLFGVRFN